MTDPVAWRSLSRPPDGRIMCCICFRYCEVAELLLDPEDGKRWDVCGDGTCAVEAGLAGDVAFRPGR